MRTHSPLLLLALVALLTGCSDDGGAATSGGDTGDVTAVEDGAAPGSDADSPEPDTVGGQDAADEPGPDAAPPADAGAPTDAGVAPDSVQLDDVEAPTDAATEDAVDASGALDVLDTSSDAVDSGGVDAAPDTGAADVAPEVVEDVPPPVPSDLYVAITSPPDGSGYDVGAPISFAGLAADSDFAETDLTATWSTWFAGELSSGPVSATGFVDFTLDAGLPEGTHTIELTVTNPLGQSAKDAVTVVVCPVSEPETFDEDIEATDWEVFGDASWDTDGDNGWLEMTGKSQSKKGQIFFTGNQIDPGDVSIAFKIFTGGGTNGGADGFAMSVVGVPDVDTLEEYVGAAGNGGCLGYGVSGACGTWTIDAFHIEFDTWQNNGNPNVDPTSANHIAVLQKGDASEHYLWATIPTIEDQKWHDVHVLVVGEHVTVTLDDKIAIDGDIPGLVFHGGYIGFSGTTGWATNYHRFDDLHVIQECSE